LKTIKIILLFVWLPILGFGQAAVHLNCIKTLLNGDVECYWNVPTNSCPATCFVSYDVYASTTGKNGLYTLLSSINNAATTTYKHVGANGNNNQNLYYFIQTICNCGAGNIVVNSDTAGNASLAIPIINYITVNGNSVLMNWQPSTSSQTFAYQIYYVDNSGYHAFDTVQGLNTVNYSSTAYNPNTQSVTFSIAAIDSCGTTGLFNSSTPQHTLFLNAAVDRCNQAVNLNWNAYVNWANGVGKYDVFLKLNHDTFKTIKTLTPLELSTVLTGFKDGDTLQIYIQASETSSTFISKSNVIKIVMNIVQPPLFSLMQTCTVDNNKDVLLEFVLDAAADIKAYNIYRSTDSVNYGLLATKAITPPLTNNAILYFDKDAAVHHQKYYYRIFSVDSCGGLHKGNQANSVLLTGNLNAYNTVDLVWNKFAIDTGTVVQYNILRSVNQGASFIYVGTRTPTDTTAWGDDIHALYASQDSIIYKIMVEYTFNHTLLHRKNVSYSNDIVIHPNSEIFIPNTIFPKGKNNVFKPIITFPDILNYNLIIFNRIGEKIFTSENYSDGWDGTKSGAEVPQGNYTYQITFEKPNGIKFVKQGNVVVVY
jgi:gliding motility-associated-like protein